MILSIPACSGTLRGARGTNIRPWEELPNSTGLCGDVGPRRRFHPVTGVEVDVRRLEAVLRVVHQRRKAVLRRRSRGVEAQLFVVGRAPEHFLAPVAEQIGALAGVALLPLFHVAPSAVKTFVSAPAPQSHLLTRLRSSNSRSRSPSTRPRTSPRAAPGRAEPLPLQVRKLAGALHISSPKWRVHVGGDIGVLVSATSVAWQSRDRAANRRSVPANFPPAWHSSSAVRSRGRRRRRCATPPAHRPS